jgi:tetratricopeptide (TPR) repeat protein
MNPRLLPFFLLLCAQLNAFTANSDNLPGTSMLHDSTRCRILQSRIENEFDASVWKVYNAQLLEIAKKQAVNYPPAHPLNKLFTFYLAEAYNNQGFLLNEERDFASALFYFNKSLALRESLGDEEAISTSLNNIASVYESKGEISKALEYYNKSLRIKEQIKDSGGISMLLNNLGYVYKNVGDIQKSLENFHMSLRIEEARHYENGVAYALNNIGSIYASQGDFDKAFEYYTQSLKRWEQLNDSKDVAISLNNIGSLYEQRGDLDNALHYYSKSEAIREKMNDLPGIAQSLNNMGGLHKNKGEFALALMYLKRALRINEETDNKEQYAFSLVLIANIYQKQGKIKEALPLARESLNIAQSLGYPEIIRNASNLLFSLYQRQGNNEAALSMLELFYQMRDSINNLETRKASSRQQLKYEYEKREIAIRADQEKKDLLYADQSKRQKITIICITDGLFLLMIFFIFILKRLRVIRRQKKIIESQKSEVDGAFMQLHEKNKELTDSIMYAKRIQNALLTTERYIEKQLQKKIR